MQKKYISLVHPTGNPNVRNVAFAMSEAGLLHEVVTTLAHDPNGHWNQQIGKLPNKVKIQLQKELSRRSWTLPSYGHIRTHVGIEIIRLVISRTDVLRYWDINNQTLVDWIYFFLDQHVAKHHLTNIDAIYAYEDGAASAFQFAKQRGIKCLYDLPIMFHRKSYMIHAEEAELYPDLAPAMVAAKEPAWKIERKEQEVELADHIFVASTITQASLLEAGVEPNKISIIPYGAPVDYFTPRPKLDKLFRALFIGGISPRKGIHYLIDAWHRLNLPNSELLLVGADLFPNGWLNRHHHYFQHIPSVPHSALNEFYSSASVFVFPSLVEGFGLVLLEAMACGLPVITTPNTAGPDIITDGVDGFIVPIRSVEALMEKIEWCYHHPEELAEMGHAARRKAEQLTWDLYRQKLVETILNVIR